MPPTPLNAAGRPSSPAIRPGQGAGRAHPNRGRSLPPDPPRVEEIAAVIKAAGTGPSGSRLRGLIAVLWRAGIPINKALTMAESDLEPGRGSLLIRHGKGDRRREVGMDEWGWEQLGPGSRSGAHSSSDRSSA